jgi:UDP-N-acetylmuramyl pentapeptide phosphotransferase/UDP-N-acetylglucosamine-1-phosphate transferase
MGVLVAAGVVVSARGGQAEFVWIGGGATVVGVISFIDDRSHVPILIRLVAHVAAAGLLLIGLRVQFWNLDLMHPMAEAIPSLLTLVFVVWWINLYNFMDGMDGFAGGMGVIGFGTLGMLGFLSGNSYFGVLSFGIAAAAAGFLVWNFPPARIFMGDSGSSVLGFLVAALSLWGHKLGLFPLWVSMLVFSPFVVDATVTLVKRILWRERFWKAHRSHYYQRLVQLGWGHKKTVLVEYGLMLGCSVTAIAILRASPTIQWLALAAWMAAYFGGMIAITKLEHSKVVSTESRG